MGVDDLVGAVVSGAADMDGVRAAASAVRALGEAAAEAVVRARTVSEVDWRSVAADRFRDELSASCLQLEACGRQLEELAVSLVRHAAAAEERVRELAVSSVLHAMAVEERLRFVGDLVVTAGGVALERARLTNPVGPWGAS